MREVPEDFGFRVEIKEDSAFARVEGREARFMVQRLRIPGYLIMHTRRLDMVMNDDASFLHCRAKFLSDIGAILKRDGEPALPHP